eukprot:GHVR01010964.1.p1 GENE.GHVR01010964.1~~GHVR01010964.1.p1  ORF type:complete len:107 (+),score=9.58 GHVR01010964.1:1868-2188(+)
METKKIITTFHKKGIAMMLLIAHDSLLITVGVRNDSPFIIYDTNRFEIRYSFVVKNRLIAVLQVCSTVNYQETNANENMNNTVIGLYEGGVIKIELSDEKWFILNF